MHKRTTRKQVTLLRYQVQKKFARVGTQKIEIVN